MAIFTTEEETNSCIYLKLHHTNSPCCIKVETSNRDAWSNARRDLSPSWREERGQSCPMDRNLSISSDNETAPVISLNSACFWQNLGKGSVGGKGSKRATCSARSSAFRIRKFSTANACRR